MPDNKVTFSMVLKKEGKHVAHYHDGVEKGGNSNDPFKDAYMPHESFQALGKPEIIHVTVETATAKPARGKGKASAKA